MAGASLLGATEAGAQTPAARKSSANAPVVDQSVLDLQAKVEQLTRELEASKQREQELLNKGAAVAA
ncbi:hypothetical protein NP590_16735, partial [Methylomonas sp. SURF-2]